MSVDTVRVERGADTPLDRLESLGHAATAAVHDVNNLLTVMQLSLRRLAKAVVPSPAVTEELITLETAVDGSRSLVRNVLDQCRGRVREPETVDVRLLTRRLPSLLRGLISPRVSFRTAIPAVELPTVKAIPCELEQVLINLCLNANDACRHGGAVTVEVNALALTAPRIHAHGVIPVGEYIVFQVHDTGIGMDAAVLARVFEPFFTTKSPERGTGIGLSTVYEITVRYGGFVSVESVPNRGTTFAVYLPVGPANHAPETAVSGAPATTVLLVDDDPLVGRAIQRTLEGMGHRVIYAGDADGALRHAREQQIDVILCDVIIPGTTGVDVVARMRAEGCERPVILMSGLTAEDVVPHLSVDDLGSFLHKPFGERELQAALERARLSASSAAAQRVR